MIKLFNNNRTAERKRPFDEFNNGVVMTHRPLRWLDKIIFLFKTIIHNNVKRDENTFHSKKSTTLTKRDNELFEIRLDRLVDKWSGSIEVAHLDKNTFSIFFLHQCDMKQGR